MSRNKATQMKRSLAAKRPASAKASLTVEKSAGAVVFFRGDQVKYLLIHSTYWEFPKGLVEPDEEEVEAALREVREETGRIVTLVDGFREDIDYFYRRPGYLVKKQVVYFLGEASGQDIKLSWEHREAKWLPFATAMQELKYDNAREVLKKANDFLTEREINR